MVKKILNLLRKLRNKYIHKSFVIDFDISDIEESKIFSNRECIDEILKMFKNDYVERISNKDYKGAEVMNEIIVRLLAMYSDFYAEDKKEDLTSKIDIITQLQEKLKATGNNTGQTK